MPGVNSSYHTIKVPSLADLTPSNSGLNSTVLAKRVIANTILYADGNRISGTMVDYSKSTPTISYLVSYGKLAI
jgi:hypothetical protein